MHNGKTVDSCVLQERLKELECLYALANISAEPDITVNRLLQKVARILPSAWQFADAACVVIVFDKTTIFSHKDTIPHFSQEACIVLNKSVRGRITIGYPADFNKKDSKPLLLEEEHRLLQQAARKVAGIVEQIEARIAHEKMQEQLRHADRLATIGQLASGVAHELNEPLGSVLGFAQLISKNPELPQEAHNDLKKIENAALHARDIIRKLMMFSRQTPPQLQRVSLNRIILESAGLWSWRCEDSDICVEYRMAEELPEIMADEAQLRQVVINLVVNAIQSMPEGGTLSITTAAGDGNIELTVSDTGCGIDTAVLSNVFDPFFTTKDIDQGTGLGLSVVHGIVTAHGGTISVNSKQGQGTVMLAQLPLKKALC